MLQSAEEPFNEVPFAIAAAVESTCLESVRARRHHPSGTTGLKALDERIGIEGFIGNDRTGGDPLDERLSLRHVYRAPGEEAALQPTRAFNERMNRGAQAAPGATERLRGVFLAHPRQGRETLL